MGFYNFVGGYGDKNPNVPEKAQKRKKALKN